MSRGRQPTVDSMDKKISVLQTSISNWGNKLEKAQKELVEFKSSRDVLVERLNSDPEYAEKYKESKKSAAVTALHAAVASGMSRQELESLVSQSSV